MTVASTIKLQLQSQFTILANSSLTITIVSDAPNWSIIYDRKTFIVQATDGWVIALSPKTITYSENHARDKHSSLLYWASDGSN